MAEAALHDTLDAVRSANADEHVIALDGDVGPWLPVGFRVVAQRGDSFSERLAAAWADCGGPTLQIGMDTPQVTSALLDESMELLRTSDSVLGLAVDGGWWALGLHAEEPTAFDGVPMSEASTGLEQRRRLRELGLEPRLLPPLVDVDTWADALAVSECAPEGRFGTRVRALRRELEHREPVRTEVRP